MAGVVVLLGCGLSPRPPCFICACTLSTEPHRFGHGYGYAVADSDSFGHADRISHAEPHSECHRDAIVYADCKPNRDPQRDIYSQWDADALPDSESVAHADADGE